VVIGEDEREVGVAAIKFENNRVVAFGGDIRDGRNEGGRCRGGLLSEVKM